MKRSFNSVSQSVVDCVSSHTRSKRPRLVPGFNSSSVKNPWVAATHLFNYMKGDPIVDWFEQGWKTKRSRSYSDCKNDGFKEFLISKGNEFEEKVIKEISNIYKVETVSEYYNPEGIKKGIELMRKGVPILHSVPLANKKNRTYGVADLIVRSDYINKICPNMSIESNGCVFSNDYHYVVIDIKFATMSLSMKSDALLNAGSFPAYKSQLWIYNEALGNIQKFTPPNTYILGRGWKRGKVGSSKYCFDKLGVSSPYTNDIHIISKAKDALKWVREVRTVGLYWSIDPPSRVELYPNMSRDAGNWQSTKHDIADKIGEITQVWMCGEKNRKHAFELGIKSWKDPLATSSTLGINGSYAVKVDNMLEVNRNPYKSILPSKMDIPTYEWRNGDNEVFVDFETFNNIFETITPLHSDMQLIYMIGIGYIENGQWVHKSLVCESPAIEEEFRIMKEFVEIIKSRGNPTINYWHAEERFWNTSCNNQFDRSDIDDSKREEILDWNILTNSLDLRKVLVNNNVAIKNCFGYSLKSIAKAMKKNGLISTPFESECTDGRTAMVKAWKCYEKCENPINSGVMKDICQYNEFDCRAIYDIITYFRDNH